MSRGSTTVLKDVVLSQESCISCGIVFAMPEDYHEALRKNGRNFYCPNGHSMTYGEAEADRLRKQLRSAETQATAAKDQAAAAHRRAEAEASRRQAAERSAAAYKGQVTNLKNRVARGQCPCCHRTFADLARHMVSQHPDFETTEVSDVPAE